MSEPYIIPLGQELPPMPGAELRITHRNGTPADTGRSRATPKRSAGGAVKRRFGLLNAFLDECVPYLSRAELAAWLLLYRHAKPSGGVIASVGDLARRAGCDESTMRRALLKLQKAGLLERLKRGSLAGGPSVWRLLLPEKGGP